LPQRQAGLDVRRVILFDHFDAGAAVRGDLADAGLAATTQTDLINRQATVLFLKRRRSAAKGDVLHS
jgi:hypothetical protein